MCRAIFGTLPDRERKLFLRDWAELLEARTTEARLVWGIDKLEMGLTMKDYLRAGGNKSRLADFNPALHLSNELRSILEKY